MQTRRSHPSRTSFIFQRLPPPPAASGDTPKIAFLEQPVSSPAPISFARLQPRLTSRGRRSIRPAPAGDCNVSRRTAAAEAASAGTARLRTYLERHLELSKGLMPTTKSGAASSGRPATPPPGFPLALSGERSFGRAAGAGQRLAAESSSPTPEPASELQRRLSASQPAARGPLSLASRRLCWLIVVPSEDSRALLGHAGSGSC